MLVRLRHADDPPAPISAEFAVDRGTQFVNRPVQLIIGLGGLAGLVFFRHSLWIFPVFFGGILVAWVWWSFAVPRWRGWALASGADPDDLQELAEDAKLVWPEGSFWERTEFRRRQLSGGDREPSN